MRSDASASYDHERIGIVFEEHEELPESVTTARERREYFDTTRRGKSNAGHPFADDLSEDEKRAVLEYLKSL